MLRIMSTNVREFATTFYEFLQVLFDDNANFIVDLLAFPSYTYPTCNWCLALNNSQKIWLENEKLVVFVKTFENWTHNLAFALLASH
jgi:hypothetical protein